MSGPIRILHAVVNMNRGGAEMLIMNLYRNIDRSKIQFDFLTCKEGVFDDEITQLGGIVHRIPYVTDIGHIGYCHALDRFFQDHPAYPVIHSHMDRMSGLVLQRAKKAGIPIRIAHSHNTRSEGGIAARLYKWYSGTHIKSSATHLLACSQTAAQWLYSRKVEEAHIVPNGIDCEKFAYSHDKQLQAREELRIDNNTFVIGHVGRFAHQKNHAFLIDTFAKVQYMFEDSILILIGDGPLRKAMEQKVENLKLAEKVKFLGVRSDIDYLLQAFDVFVFPSFHEGLPVTLIEAQGVGLPCVISDRITPEVDMGADLIHYMELSKSPAMWANQVISCKREKRDSKSYIEERGYNIRSSAKWLENYYMGECR